MHDKTPHCKQRCPTCARNAPLARPTRRPAKEGNAAGILLARHRLHVALSNVRQPGGDLVDGIKAELQRLVDRHAPRVGRYLAVVGDELVSCRRLVVSGVEKRSFKVDSPVDEVLRPRGRRRAETYLI